VGARATAPGMLLELQRSLLRQHPGQRSATVIGHRTPSSWPRAGLHPVRQRLGRAGGRRRGEADDGANRVQQLASREAAAASSAENGHRVDGQHEQDVDVKAILSDPRLEGDPLQFLKVTEAYWTVRPLPSFSRTKCSSRTRGAPSPIRWLSRAPHLSNVRWASTAQCHRNLWCEALT